MIERYIQESCECGVLHDDVEINVPIGHLSGLMSTAMIREAPAALAPMMAARPTHPHPNTATLDPAYTETRAVI